MRIKKPNFVDKKYYSPTFAGVTLLKMILTITLDKVFIAKFLKFGVVGGSGVIVDFFFTWLAKEKLGIQKYLANAIGFIIAASTNWIFNRIWTFESKNPDLLAEYSEFLVISLVGLAINSLVLWVLTDKFKFNFYLSKLGAIAITTVWNFFANYLITFA